MELLLITVDGNTLIGSSSTLHMLKRDAKEHLNWQAVAKQCNHPTPPLKPSRFAK